jgi:conjugative relaxase-like TrwC/TraI family protein
VLTVRKVGVTVGNAASVMAAVDYILDLEESPEAFNKAEYYAGEEGGEAVPLSGPPSRRWMGSGEAAQILGVELGSEVEREQLRRAMQGQHVRTGKQLRRPGTRSVPVRDETGEPILDPEGKPYLTEELRVNNADLTCSVPKSVSAVWAQADPELKAQIQEAVMRSAETTLRYMVETKPVIQKTGEPASGFVASMALHVTSRRAKGEKVPSPQLHVHGVIVGVDDGQGHLRTPDTSAFFKHDAPLEGGALFRALLAEELRRLGFDLEAGTGNRRRFFEIVGVPKDLIEHWSARTREVLDEIAREEEARGDRLSGPELAAMALRTRQPKDKDLPLEAVARQWHADAGERGFGREAVDGLRHGPRLERDPVGMREAAKTEIIKRIWEQGPTVTMARARGFAYELAPIGFTYEEALALIDEMQREGDLVALQGERDEQTREGTIRQPVDLVTSREIRGTEEGVMEIAVSAAERSASPLSAAAKRRGIEVADGVLRAKGGSLEGEQRRAIEKLTGGAGWSALTGLAGTGKGPVLQAVAEAHRADGFQVVACAIDGTTAQRLGHQVQGEAMTIEQFLKRAARGKIEVGGGTLILIDEASKVGLEDWSRIAEHVDRNGARVVAVGHTGQLGAIELPGMFEEMLRDSRIATATLTKIRRHLDPERPGELHPWLGEYQVALHRGDGERALELLRANNAISMHETRADAIEAMIERWDHRRRRYKDPRAAVIVVHGSNKEVDLVNKLAQDRRFAAGELGGPGVKAVDASYKLYRGDVVILREAPYQPEPAAPGSPRPRRVENGTMGIVVGVDSRRGRVRVRLDEPRPPGVKPREVEFDQAALAARKARGEKSVPALRLGYGSHVFPLMGDTRMEVFSLDGDRTQNNESTYTAHTRTVFHLHVFTDRESLGRNATEEQRWRNYVAKISRSQKELASLRWERSGRRIALDFGRGRATQARERPRSDSAVLRMRPAVSVESLLRPRRGVLGLRRSEIFEGYAKKVAQEMRRSSTADLMREHEAGRKAWELLDPHSARQTVRLEGELDLAREHGQEFADRAEGLERKARAIRRDRRRRKDVLEEAATARRLAERDTELAERLEESLDRLRAKDKDSSLDGWMREHGRQAARGIAAEHVLAARRERRVARAVKRAKARPPAHVRDLIGSAPRKSSPERPEWEGLLERIERDRITREGGFDQRTESKRARDQRELARDIQRWREQRGLEPREVAETLRGAGQPVEMGF